MRFEEEYRKNRDAAMKQQQETERTHDPTEWSGMGNGSLPFLPFSPFELHKKTVTSSVFPEELIPIAFPVACLLNRVCAPLWERACDDRLLLFLFW